MVRKYVYGTPFETEAVIKEVAAETGLPSYGKISLEEGFSFTYQLAEDDINATRAEVFPLQPSLF